MAREDDQFPKEVTEAELSKREQTGKMKEGLSQTTENKEHNAEESDLKPKAKEHSQTVEDKEDSDITATAECKLENSLGKKTGQSEVQGDTITAGQLKPLATKQKHLQVRKVANQKFLENTKCIGEKYSKRRCKKPISFYVGENVSVRILRTDRRTPTDLPLLSCTIVQICGKARVQYHLRCRHGVLNRCYDAGDLEPFPLSFDIPGRDWKLANKISIHEAAKLQAPWNSFIRNRCKC